MDSTPFQVFMLINWLYTVLYNTFHCRNYRHVHQSFRGLPLLLFLCHFIGILCFPLYLVFCISSFIISDNGGDYAILTVYASVCWGQIYTKFSNSIWDWYKSIKY